MDNDIQRVNNRYAYSRLKLIYDTLRDCPGIDRTAPPPLLYMDARYEFNDMQSERQRAVLTDFCNQCARMLVVSLASLQQCPPLWQRLEQDSPSAVHVIVKLAQSTGERLLVPVKQLLTVMCFLAVRYPSAPFITLLRPYTRLYTVMNGALPRQDS